MLIIFPSLVFYEISQSAINERMQARLTRQVLF